MKGPDESGTMRDLVKYRLENAENDLREATILMKAESYNGVLNRAYYAVFHSVSAIHALDGKSFRRHKDTLGDFNKNYINTEIFPKEYGRLIYRTEDVRLDSDYTDYYVATKEEAGKRLAFAEEFVRVVREYCEARLDKNHSI